MPGFVDGKDGVLRYGAMYRWKNKPLAEEIKKRVHLECYAENNARCRAFGELMFNRTKWPETFAYFFISRGLSCPLMIQSQLHTGSMAGEGEIGHMVVDRFGPVCPTCGNRGCLEAFSSETAIVNRCAELLKQNKNTILRKTCCNPAAPRISEILRAQKYGDAMVQSVMEEAITYAGIAIANVINLINPPLLLVDAYIMQEKMNREMFLQIVRKNLFALNLTEVNIEFLPFDKLRAARGAAALVIKK
ncbi:ROK family protein [gut metagenome]|uniref:ROK family protein n=1 Tax=gut metagenome TaxID=749906 RepID=J9G4B9_9ZZZZ